MSVFQLGDGSNPYAGRFPVDASEDLLDDEDEIEDDLKDFDEAAGLLGDLDTATLAQVLLDDPGKTEPPQTGLQVLMAQPELPLSHTTAPRAPSLPFNGAAPTELPASEGTAMQRMTPILTNEPSSFSIGGPYWGAELAWKRTVKTAKERKANDEDDEDDADDEAERSRKRRAAWRKYNETARERRLKGDL